MSHLTKEEEEQKKAIFEAMGARRKKYIERIGYERWDPFQKPKDPIDIRRDTTNRTTQQLVREFLSMVPPDKVSNAYSGGVLELALGIVNEEDRFRGMFEFACWYKEELEKAKK